MFAQCNQLTSSIGTNTQLPMLICSKAPCRMCSFLCICILVVSRTQYSIRPSDLRLLPFYVKKSCWKTPVRPTIILNSLLCFTLQSIHFRWPNGTPNSTKSYSTLYLCVLEHPEVGVHVEGALFLPRLLVELGRLAELALVGAHVPEKHVVIVLPALPPLLRTIINIIRLPLTLNNMCDGTTVCNWNQTGGRTGTRTTGDNRYQPLVSLSRFRRLNIYPGLQNEKGSFVVYMQWSSNFTFKCPKFPPKLF